MDDAARQVVRKVTQCEASEDQLHITLDAEFENHERVCLEIPVEQVTEIQGRLAAAMDDAVLFPGRPLQRDGKHVLAQPWIIDVSPMGNGSFVVCFRHPQTPALHFEFSREKLEGAVEVMTCALKAEQP